MIARRVAVRLLIVEENIGVVGAQEVAFIHAAEE